MFGALAAFADPGLRRSDRGSGHSWVWRSLLWCSLRGSRMLVEEVAAGRQKRRSRRSERRRRGLWWLELSIEAVMPHSRLRQGGWVGQHPLLQQRRCSCREEAAGSRAHDYTGRLWAQEAPQMQESCRPVIRHSVIERSLLRGNVVCADQTRSDGMPKRQWPKSQKPMAHGTLCLRAEKSLPVKTNRRARATLLFSSRLEP